MRCLGRIIMLALIGTVLVIALAVATSEQADETGSPTATQEARQGRTEQVTPTQTREDEVEPAQFEIVLTEDVSTGVRERYRTEIVIDTEVSDEALIAGMAEAVRQVLRENPSAHSVVVFAWADESAIQVEPIVARAFASRDGRGQGGDGKGLLGPDEEGTIQIEIRSMTDAQRVVTVEQ